jgi:RHS repeat-associated protein
MKPFGSYHGGNIDTVSLFNGQLSLDIPLISYPQRGGKLKLEFHLTYANVGAQADYFRISNPPYGYITYYSSSAPVGWCGSNNMGADLCHGFHVVDEQSVGDFMTASSTSMGSYTQNAISATVLMPDGATHALFPTCGTCSPSIWESVDGTSFRIQCYATWGCPVSGGGSASYNVSGTTIIDSAGINYVFPTSGQAYRQDTNGNKITYSGSGVGLTDTMGRVIPSIPTPTSNVTGCPQPPSVPYVPTSAATWSLPGVSNGSYPILFCYIQLSETNPIAYELNGGPWQPGTYTGTELQSVVLPNGTGWTFEYTTDGNADLSEVIFPTGGTLSYGSYQNVANAGIGGAYADYNRAVGFRTLNPNDGVTPSSTWTYTYSSSAGTTTVSSPPSGTTPDDTVHTFTDFNPGAGFETQTQYYQGSHSSGTLLKTTTTQYSSTNLQYGCYGFLCVVNIVPSQTSTVWPNGQQNKTAYTYDSGIQVYTPFWDCYSGGSCPFAGSALATAIYGKVLTKSEYDYGGSSPLRTTTNTYLALNSSSYLAANLLDLPSSVQVTGAGPGSNTTYSYDENNGSPQGVLGNLTSMHRWLNTTGTYLVSSNVYTSNGLVTSSFDPNNNKTSYGYAPSSCPANSGYAGSGPTSVTNALTQTTSNCYDLTAGLLVSTTDPNSLTTSYAYDNMLRTLQIDNPDGGQALFCYTDTGTETNGGTCSKSSPPYEVTISEKISSSAKRLSYLIVDGVGRQIRQAVTNGETSPYDEADTCYDGDGRVRFKSYPFQDSGPFSTSRYCASPELGDTFTYEGLSRTTKVTHSDGSYISTSYSGSSTTVTDEQGKTRQSTTDGLGRLTQVIENPGGLGYTTAYTYDTLDNLTGVTQAGSRQRTFVYDSLSRLTSASNPESGATAYTYDADSNVATKTDARNISTTYSYDTLNRITQKTYSDGTTPSAAFVYDADGNWGYPQTNTVGRLIEDYIEPCCTNVEIFSYDPMGRVLLNNQYTPTMSYPVSYTYNLIGDTTSYTNPFGVVFSQSYNPAGRVNQVTSSWSDAQHPGALASSIHYNAAGSMTAASYGNGLTETAAYNPRLQLCRANVNSSGTLLGSCTDAIPSGNVLDLNAGFNYGSGDNGNVMSFSAVGAQTFSRSYAYDALNRLSTMSSPGSGCSGLSWTYDAWGNRPSQTATGGSCYQPQYTVNGNNQLTSPYQYDAAGNMTYDGTHHYTYDAENRLSAVDSGGTASYVYDANGRRFQKTAGGVTTNYVYDLSGRVLSEYGTCQTCWNVGYIYLNGGLAAIYQSGTTQFAHADHLGSTRLLTGYPTPSILECDDYYPFGESISCGATGITTHKFTGKERDSESGLDNFGARYDSSQYGRFMTADPFTVTPGRVVDPQQLNLYAYVRNNPLKHIDPTGMIIDDAACNADKKHCGNDWQKVQAIINAQDKNGNYLHPELHNIFSTLQSDSRTFVIGNAKLPGNEGGVTTITNFTADGQDFTRATLQVDFSKIKAITQVSKPDLVPGFEAFTGLLGAPIDRLAETFGHEGAHGLFSIQNPAEAVGIQQLLNQRDAAMQGQHYPYPPDVMQQMDAAQKGLIPTETFAQQEEKIVNGELQADKKKQ